MKTCQEQNTSAAQLIPPDTNFWRPMMHGQVTSEFGRRLHPIFGDWRLHDGIDLSHDNSNNIPIYATAQGKVAKITYDAARGHYIVIHHNINGLHYTSTYLHLMTGSIRVTEGALITKETVLALMGATGNSTGPHLHFSVAAGLWYKDYHAYDTFVEKVLNPRNVVNFPPLGVCWDKGRL